jgi:hypothetical protein
MFVQLHQLWRAGLWRHVPPIIAAIRYILCCNWWLECRFSTRSWLGGHWAASGTNAITALFGRPWLCRYENFRVPGATGTNTIMTSAMPAEDFKPVPVRRGNSFVAHFVFALRMVLDLQLLTCVRFLTPRLAALQGNILDVGCGEMPFRGSLPSSCSYTGLDVPQAKDFGMIGSADVITFDGTTIRSVLQASIMFFAPKCLSTPAIRWP